mmetsp:Transcript_27720/g.94616  ORF Transcript_27720/g.94616 Transcript_27720/m.94616 type:complete len:237 (+) Transcript_27720:1288-1998(+)
MRVVQPWPGRDPGGEGRRRPQDPGCMGRRRRGPRPGPRQAAQAGQQQPARPLLPPHEEGGDAGAREAQEVPGDRGEEGRHQVHLPRAAQAVRGAAGAVPQVRQDAEGPRGQGGGRRVVLRGRVPGRLASRGGAGRARGVRRPGGVRPHAVRAAHHDAQGGRRHRAGGQQAPVRGGAGRGELHPQRLQAGARGQLVPDHNGAQHGRQEHVHTPGGRVRAHGAGGLLRAVHLRLHRRA